MRESGFSLIELLVVIAVVGTLLAIGTLQFNQYTQKANIESQVRTMYSDLQKARTEALLQKMNRSFTVTAALFRIYSTSDGSGTPIRETTFKYPVVFDNSSSISFNSRGMATGRKTVCVEMTGTPAFIDSIVITETMIQLGIRDGGNCQSGNVKAR